MKTMPVDITVPVNCVNCTCKLKLFIPLFTWDPGQKKIRDPE
jgi:hypothetical protein